MQPIYFCGNQCASFNEIPDTAVAGMPCIFMPRPSYRGAAVRSGIEAKKCIAAGCRNQFAPIMGRIMFYRPTEIFNLPVALRSNEINTIQNNNSLLVGCLEMWAGMFPRRANFTPSRIRPILA